MNEDQAKQILAVLPKYEVVDITVAECTRTACEATVIYTEDGGDLKKMRVQYQRRTERLPSCIQLIPEIVDGCIPQETYKAQSRAFRELGDEVIDDCAEAVAYQRDLNKEMN